MASRRIVFNPEFLPAKEAPSGHADHACEAPGCRERFASHGVRSPGWTALRAHERLRWFCAAHKPREASR